ncbi:hypothetical protein [Microbaculum sp. FT89]|uniref:hypothetical protein n=1 Tax=Microbaculum sp. FT89 TaxID=3447298 RepID=UPI003F53873D
MTLDSADNGDLSPDAPPKGRRVTIMGRKYRVPDSPRIRLGAGLALIVGGVLGFLPVLGFWMIPLGLVILSVDMPAVRRVRRRMEVYFGRKANGLRGNGNGRGKNGHADSRRER